MAVIRRNRGLVALALALLAVLICGAIVLAAQSGEATVNQPDRLDEVDHVGATNGAGAAGYVSTITGSGKDGDSKADARDGDASASVAGDSESGTDADAQAIATSG